MLWHRKERRHSVAREGGCGCEVGNVGSAAREVRQIGPEVEEVNHIGAGSTNKRLRSGRKYVLSPASHVSTPPVSVDALMVPPLKL